MFEELDMTTVRTPTDHLTRSFIKGQRENEPTQFHIYQRKISRLVGFSVDPETCSTELTEKFSRVAPS